MTTEMGIVDRLRATDEQVTIGLKWAAADEIKRLREALLAVKGKLTCDAPDVQSALFHVERALDGSREDI